MNNKDFEYAQELVAELASNGVYGVIIEDKAGQVYLTFDGLSLKTNLVGNVAVFTAINEALRILKLQTLANVHYSTKDYVVYLSVDDHPIYGRKIRLNAFWTTLTVVENGSYIERADIGLAVNREDIEKKIAAWKETSPWIEERQERRHFIESSDDCGYFGYGH